MNLKRELHLINDFKIAHKILLNVLYKDMKSNEQINIFIDQMTNPSLVTKIVYGVLENKIYLDYMIRKLSSIRLKKIHPRVLTILEIGFYNIHFLNTKDYAVVDQLVELTKANNKKSTAFVNALLRNFIRDEDEIAKIKESDDIKSLSIRYSLKEDLTRYIYDNYGMDYTKKFLRYINSEQVISIRINNLKITKDKLRERLENQGFIIKEGLISKNALRVINPSKLVNTLEFKEGYFTIQQEASMKAVEVLDPRESTRILDLCAAPGTKTSYIGECIKNNGEIIANDISFNKMDLIKENINRLGLTNIKLTNSDATIYKKEWENSFDYCLVDAPCSGLGVMGRKPEIRYNRSIDDIYNLADLQKNILKNAISYLKEGAILVYSTCTIGNIENLNNFSYLKNHKSLELMPIEGKEYIEYANFLAETDGFFISKFKKI